MTVGTPGSTVTVLEHADRPVAPMATVGTNPVGKNPGGKNPVGAGRTGKDPVGKNPGGQNPVGTDPAGTDPVGKNPGGKNPVGPSLVGFREGVNGYLPMGGGRLLSSESVRIGIGGGG